MQVEALEGRIEMVITHLEMLAPPAGAPRAAPPAVAAVALVEPTVARYRELYAGVGDAWLWYERRLLDDHALGAVIRDPGVEIHTLQRDGVTAGYVELDHRVAGEVELAYFGLLPEYTGQGLGGWFLDWSIRRAWAAGPRRVWVHTCNLDHPAALAVYQHLGFVVCGRERCWVDDPRVAGAMPPGREFKTSVPG